MFPNGPQGFLDIILTVNEIIASTTYSYNFSITEIIFSLNLSKS